MEKTAVIEKATTAHIDKFGKTPDSKAWAPGRIEVVGNHTDYNEGTVLSAAIDRGHAFCISKSDKPGIRLLAVDVDQVAEFDTSDMEKVSGAGWANYVKGVFFYIQEITGEPIDAIDCTFFGSIPMGAGLSSSAALEVASATAVLNLIGKTLDLKEVAKLCQKAEQKFAGTNCGLLDQFSSIFGRHHGLIHSDFRSLEVSGVDLPDDIEFLVVNPKVQHSLADSPYNERRERCEQAAEELAKRIDHPVSALRDVSWEEFEQFKGQIDPGAAKRAAHVVGEITRVEQGVEQLKSGDLTAFGAALFESHQSSIENFENSCPELDVVVGAAREAGALGARLSGGGFGGAAIVMVREADAKATGETISALCAEKGITPEILTVIPSAGAEVIQ
ncbi:galactokinase [Tichowtungia aerotolerans]|uniref:Galactokinase n=1 Tax=Tichowtungia aerotolerans TaxID=2697043 RepID=A0A6P1M4Y5_9BACT|nr:galactokinase [Tichowtungia aerotolerans]QHI68911.1 galactokinase [Tichowtungia aerotolerans]